MVSLDEWSIDELMRALEKPEKSEERELDCLTIGDREVPAVYFHLPEEPNGFLSNWYPAEIKLNGIRFSSAEQFIMYSKARWMGDREAAKAILCEKSPEEQQKLGRDVQGYHEQVMFMSVRAGTKASA